MLLSKSEMNDSLIYQLGSVPFYHTMYKVQFLYAKSGYIPTIKFDESNLHTWLSVSPTVDGKYLSLTGVSSLTGV